MPGRYGRRQVTDDGYLHPVVVTYDRNDREAGQPLHSDHAVCHHIIQQYTQSRPRDLCLVFDSPVGCDPFASLAVDGLRVDGDIFVAFVGVKQEAEV